MSSFTDDFNRADGAIGNGWTVGGVSPRIASGNVISTSNGRFQRIIASGSDYHVSEIDTWHDAGTSAYGFPTVKMDSTGITGYAATATETANGYTFTLTKYTNGGSSVLTSQSYTVSKVSPIHIKLTYDAGALTAVLNGTHTLTATDSTHAANNYQGARAPVSITHVDNYAGTTDRPVAFDEVIEPIVQMAVEQGVEFVGTGTAWTPGAPGDPVFTVDKGTLSGQEIQSATQATANYLPPQADDIATFTDPSTGQTDQVALSTGFQVNAGEGCKLTDDGAAIVNAAGAAYPASLVLTEDTVITETYGIELKAGLLELLLGSRKTTGVVTNYNAGDTPLIYKLWSILNAGEDPQEGINILGQAYIAAGQATQACQWIEALTDNRTNTLQTILDAIGPTAATDIADILAQLVAIRTDALLTLQSPVDAVINAQGLGLPTIRDVLDLVDTIKTTNGWDLESVHTWTGDILNALTALESNILLTITEQTGIINQHIDATEQAIRGLDSVDLTQLHDQSNAIWGSDHHSVSDVYNLLDTIPGTDDRNLTEIYNAVLALPQSQVSLQPVLTAINNLSAQLSNVQTSILNAIAAIRPADYPLWPGAGSATLGVPVSGAGDLAIPGPLDGLLIDVTAWPRDIEAWTNGGTRALKYAGHITFVSDIAYTEEIQFPATNKRVVVPKSMLTAASALVHLRAGVQATITPWSYTP